jgi:hypothetical protein
MSSNSGCSSAPRLMSLQAGIYLTTRLVVARQQLTTIGVPPPITPSPRATACDNLQQVCLPTANCRLTPLDRLSCVLILQIEPLHRPTENTASKNSSIVARHRYRHGPHRKHRSQQYCHWFHGWHDGFHYCITVYCAIS